jgi:hypothetical protein
MNRSYKDKLRENLEQYFSIDELRNLCFDMGIPYENLSGETKPRLVRELIGYCERHDQILELNRRVKILRPHIKGLNIPENYMFLSNTSKLLITLSILLLVFLTTASIYVFTTYQSKTFVYEVRVLSRDTAYPIENAHVILDVIGRSPYDKYTDSRGTVRFIIETNQSGNPAILNVQAIDHQSKTESIILLKNSLTYQIVLDHEH